MSLWILTSSRICPPAATDSTSRFSMAFMMNFIALSDILIIFRPSIIQIYGTISLIFFKSIHAMSTFFHCVLAPWEWADIYIYIYIYREREREGHLFLLFPSSIFSVLLEIVSGIQASHRFLLWSVRLRIFYIISKNVISLLLLEMFSFWRSFRIKFVFPFVNHSVIIVSCMHLFGY